MSDESTVKPGYKSTEFWLSSIAILVGIVMASGAIVEDSPVAQAIGVAASVLGAMGYSVSRGMAKKGVKILMFALVLPILLAGCVCTIQKQAIEELDDTNDLIFPEYMLLVEKEFAGNAEKIENRKFLIQTAEELIDRLKKQTE